MDRVWLLAIDALDASDAPVTLRYASAEHNDTFSWDVRLIQPALFTVAAFGNDLASGSRSGYGEALLINEDGGLNHLVDYAMDGRDAILSLATPSGVDQILLGTVSRVSFNGKEVSIALRDPQEALQQSHPFTVYAGNNSLPNGLEGLASDIKGQPKPQVFGKVSNVTPQLVNTSKLIYQVDTGTGSTVAAVYDKGVSLTNGGAYPDLTTLQSTAPSAGQFRAFQGYFRLGGTPAGQVTTDVNGSPAGLGSVFELLANAAGLTVDAGDVTAADAVGEVGIYLDRERDTAEMFDSLAASMGGYWSFDAAGVIRLRQLVAPVGPVLELLDYEVTSLERDSAGAGENGLPIWRVVVKADRVETVQTEVAAAATNAARVANQYRDAVSEDTATKTRHPLSDELVIESDLRSLADAATQAARLRDLLKVRRDRIKVSARITESMATALSIGIVVTLKTDRLGYSAGRDLIVIGYTLDAGANQVELNLWG